MLKLNNFSVISKGSLEGGRQSASRRPIREKIGTAIMNFGRRMGGRSQREESLKEIVELAVLDSNLSRDTSSTFQGPWC